MKKWRIWIFRMIAVTVLPALLLVFIEVGLRVLGVGHPTGFTVSCHVNGRHAYCNNDTFSRLYFPENLAQQSVPFVIPAEKQSGTYRIVVLGGSAAQGDPEPIFGVARILKTMLQDRFPAIDFEVINAAVTAINSHVVFQIAKDMLRHEPDLMILYLGNNEVVGPFGAGTVFAPLSSNLWLIRAGIFCKSTAIGQMLQRFLKWVVPKKKSLTEWRGMEMFLEKQIRASDPGLGKVYRHFQKNLEDMLRLSGSGDLKTILCTVGSNLKDSPPFSSLHRPGLSSQESRDWKEAYQAGIEKETAGRYAEAVPFYLVALHIDNQFAALHYRLGKCYWMQGRYDDAKQQYLLARDLDALRFRVDTAINRIVRKVGKSDAPNVFLLDAAEVLAGKSPHETPGEELFYDHVHLNFKGNYVLAERIFEQVVDILPEGVRRKGKNRQTLTEEQCRNRLAFTDYDRRRIIAEMSRRLKKAPFTDQIYHQARLRRLAQVLDGLQGDTGRPRLRDSVLIYQAALEANQHDPWLHYNFAGLLQADEKTKEASEHLTAFLDRIPHYLPAYEKLAGLLIRQGRFEEAIRQCETAIRIKPQFAPVYYHMAFALAKQGKFNESIATYKDLIHLSPEKAVDTYNQVGTILVHLDRLEEAAQMFQKAIEQNQNVKSPKPIPDVYFNLGHVMKRLGRIQPSHNALEVAVKGYGEALHRNPASSETLLLLGRALVEKSEPEQALRYFKRAIEISPANPVLHMHTIKALENLGRFSEAIAATEKAIRIATNQGPREAVPVFQRYLNHLESRSRSIKGKYDEGGNRFTSSKNQFSHEW